MMLVALAGYALAPVAGMLGDPARGPRTFYIASESMLPTLALNDRVRPLMPTTNAITRGTVVMVPDGDTQRIYRVAAIGGDRFAMHGGNVVLNGAVVPRRPAGIGPVLSDGSATRLLTEQFPGEALPHRVLASGTSPFQDAGEIRIPAGDLFLLGDNRDRVADSRAPMDEMGIGIVRAANVTGIVDRVMWRAGFHHLGESIDGPAATPATPS